MKTHIIKLIKLFASLIFATGVTLAAIYFAAHAVPSVREGIVDAAHNTPFESVVESLFADASKNSSAAHEEDETPAAQTEILEIALSPTAAKNIGLAEPQKLVLRDFPKTLNFPAIVAEHAGRATLVVPSSVSGVVTKIYHEAGVAITAGDPLFDIALNQQEVVAEQSKYLTLLQKREINQSELERLGQLDPEIAPRQRRELLYQQAEIALEIGTQRNILRLQGLSEAMIVESLDAAREMISSITMVAPLGHSPLAPAHHHVKNCAECENKNEDLHDPLTLDILYVVQGQSVTVGESLCQLSDLCELVIRGKVFASNEAALNQALDAQSRVTAIFEGARGAREVVENLHVRSIDNRIDTESGTLQCYIDLPNEYRMHTVAGNPPRRYAQWRFKPGQRCELQVEYEIMPQVFVVPIDAVANDVADTYLFVWVGNEDDRRIWRKTPVHLVLKTKDVAVIANDGAVFPGTKIAVNSASLIFAALLAAQNAGAGGGGIQHGDHVH